MPDATAPTSTPVRRTLTLVAMVGAVLIGCGLVLVAVTLGDCSAFGGRCPAEPTPLVDDDTFGMAAVGAALAIGVPVFLTAPSRRRAVIALAVALVAALAVGLMARASASG